MATDPPPTALDPILALPDPGERLDGLTAYLARVEQQQTRAREARAATITELRAAGVTWRALASRSGLSEQYLRGLAK